MIEGPRTTRKRTEKAILQVFHNITPLRFRRSLVVIDDYYVVVVVSESLLTYPLERPAPLVILFEVAATKWASPSTLRVPVPDTVSAV